jgi:PDZ domain
MISRCNSGVLRISLIMAWSLVVPSSRVAHAGPQESGARKITIPDGTPIHLYLMDDLNSKKAKNGDAIRFKARLGVQVDDVEVITADTPIAGHVGAVGHSSFAGHSGKLDLLIDYAVAIDGSRIPLRGEATLKGGSNGAVTAAATAYYGPAALLIRGWEADIHRGTMLNAYVNGDQIVNLRSSDESSYPVQKVASGTMEAVGALSTRPPAVQGTIGVSCDGNPSVRRNGITVSQVVDGSPADQAGIKAGDVILAIDDRYLYMIEELNNVIARSKPGARIRIRYRRFTATYEMPLIIGSSEANEGQH